MSDWESRMSERAKQRAGPSPTYGDLGSPLPDSFCRQCWGDRHVWIGDVWGIAHSPEVDLHKCDHACHQGDVWDASA